jgi:hypothetical protein
LKCLIRLVDFVNFFFVEFLRDKKVLKIHVPEDAINFRTHATPDEILSLVHVIKFIPIIVFNGLFTGLSFFKLSFHIKV